MDINDLPDDPDDDADDNAYGGFLFEDALAPFRESIDRTVRDLTKAMRFELPKDFFPKVDLGSLVQIPDLAAMSGLADVAESVFSRIDAYDTILAPLRDQLASLDWSHLMPKIDTSVFEDVARLVERHLPPNWKDVDWHEASDFINETAWPIVWLPRSDVVAELLSCEPADRPTVLSRRRAELLDDAVSLLDEVSWEDLAYLASCTRDVVGALRDGHDRPAQSFTASILTGVLHSVLEYKTLKEARNAFNANWKEESIFLVRFALITSTIPSALAQFFPHNGDPVPVTFNRHALAHAPDPAQLTETNALVGLMLVTSMIRELQALHDEGRLA